MKKDNSSICEMCGHHVAILQKAHILAEGKKSGGNILMLCPTCHIMFDTHLKPKIFNALNEYGINLPKSWKTSIYEQAAAESMKARLKKELITRRCTRSQPAGLLPGELFVRHKRRVA